MFAYSQFDAVKSVSTIAGIASFQNWWRWATIQGILI